jgi:UPF0271 protein
MRVDLNVDVGEGLDLDDAGDEALLRQATSANIACGVHAGSPEVMRATVALARLVDVAIGAHPGFADREGFGRREMHLSAHEVEALVSAQVEALATIAAAQGTRLQHVKPHGALYNMAARDESLASSIARAVKACDASLILMGLARSALVSSAERIGLQTAAEGFADRAYLSDGTLVSRTEPGSVIHDPRIVIDRALRMIADGVVVASTGEKVRLRVDSLCLHGDTPGAATLARGLRAALVEAGVTIRALAIRT